MDKCREEFEKAFPIPAHWIEFDEKANRYYCPYVADTTASEYQSKWVVWQHQQAKVEELDKEWLEMNQALEKSNQVGFQVEAENRELQKRVDKALQEIKGAARWIDEDAIDDPNFIKGGVLSALRRLEQALKGEADE